MNSVVVQIHGVAIPNDGSDAQGQAAAGVYFGKGCLHNKLVSLPQGLQSTNSRAILVAIKTALDELILMRHTMLDPRWKEVFIMTNSEYARKSFHEWVWQWEVNGWQHIGRKGTVENLDLLQEIHGQLIHIETALTMAVRF